MLSTQNSYGNNKLTSSAAVVAQKIVKAAQANKPKTRYPVGRFARLLMWTRKCLSDRVFDRVIMSQMKN